MPPNFGSRLWPSSERRCLSQLLVSCIVQQIFSTLRVKFVAVNVDLGRKPVTTPGV